MLKFFKIILLVVTLVNLIASEEVKCPGAGVNVDGDCIGDRDLDRIPDNKDNCPNIPNSDQLDMDSDGKGDPCDPDADGDGILNENDNCPLIYNPDQADENQDGVGDICESDSGPDIVSNDLDCPNNAAIVPIDFRTFQTVALYPKGDSQIDPNWVIYNKGKELVQKTNSEPGLAVGYDSVAGLDFEGSLFVDSEKDDGYIGFIFGFQNSHKFYAVMWKKAFENYSRHQPFNATAEAGIQIKLVDSKTGPGEMMRNSLWHTGDTKDEVKLLWKDPKNVGWKERTPYRWLLLHRPNIGLMRLRIFDGEKTVADSGNIYDSTLKRGRLGAFCFSQELVIWSDLIYRCNEKIPKLIYQELPADLQKQVEMIV